MVLGRREVRMLGAQELRGAVGEDPEVVTEMCAAETPARERM